MNKGERAIRGEEKRRERESHEERFQLLRREGKGEKVE